MPSRDANVNHMLAELESLGHGMTAWEQRFLEDIMDKWERTQRLTPPERAKLEEIYQARVK